MYLLCARPQGVVEAYALSGAVEQACELQRIHSNPTQFVNKRSPDRLSCTRAHRDCMHTPISSSSRWSESAKRHTVHVGAYARLFES
eukprot:6204585-Pleurochrysis_carterae.AAC.1